MPFSEPLSLDVVPTRHFRVAARDRLRGALSEPLAAAPWPERVAAVAGFRVDLDVLWPADPHWMPVGWADEKDPVERLRLVAENPVLAALALSVNAAYPLLPDPHARAFLNSHTALGAAVGGCRTDAEIAVSALQMQELAPGPSTLVDDSRLPDIVSVLHFLNIFSKLSLIKNNQIPFLDILKKGLPLLGSDKQIEEMVCRECDNEMFYRTFTYMVLCCIMGTYDWIGECPYDFVTQTWITHFFMFRQRASMVGDYADPSNRNLMLYACTAFLIHSIELVPPLEEMVREMYDWDNIVDITREAVVRMRIALVDARYTGRLAGPSPELLRIVADVLPDHSKTLKDSFRTKKSCVSSICPHIRNAARSFSTVGVVGEEPGPAPMDTIAEIHQGHFAHAVTLSQTFGVGITHDSFAAMPFTPRGRATALSILNTLERGEQSTVDMYTRFGPGDFSVFMAYIAAQRELLRFEYHVLPDRVTARQEQAIRKKHLLVEWEPLPREATHLPFCFSCERFKVYPAGEKRTGMWRVSYSPFTGSIYCVNNKNPDCCHLTEIPMLGGAFTVDRATWMICCYCAQLCNYGHPDMLDSYWWCGHCDRE